MILDDLIKNIPAILDELDLKEALAARDSMAMVCEYTRVYKDIENLKIENKQLYEEVKDDCELMVNRAFKVADYVCGDGDISACLANDYELIYLANVFEYNDYWLNRVISLYEEGIFPTEII